MIKDLILKVQDKEYTDDLKNKTVKYQDFYVTVEFMGESLDISLKPKDALSKKILSRVLTGE